MKRRYTDMLGLRWLRAVLEGIILDALKLSSSFKVLDGNIVHMVELKVQRFMWWFIPLFSAEECGVYDLASRLRTSFLAKLIESRATLVRFVHEFKTNFSSKVIPRLKNSLTQRIGRTRNSAIATLIQRYTPLHSELVGPIIQQSRNDFRKQLLERLGEAGADVFATSVQKNLAALVLKTKEMYGGANRTPKKGGVYLSDVPLPTGTKFVFQESDSTVFVIEQMPQVRTVWFLDKHYQLAFPFTIFLAVFNKNQFVNFYCFFRNQTLQSKDDILLCPALTNIGSSFKVCFPHPNSRGTPAKIADEAIQNFWGSSFNGDWASFFDTAKSRLREISSLSQWQSNTKKDSRFVLQLDWGSTGMSVETVGNRILNSGGGEEHDGQTPPPLSDLERFVLQLKQKVAKDIQEALFFLIPRLGIDEQSLAQATQHIERVITEEATRLKEKFEADIDATFAPEKIQAVSEGACEEALESLEVELKSERFEQMLQDISF